MLIVELKSEALKERHWKTLMRKLHVNWVLSDLSLGQVWDVDLQKNEMIVKDVILVAQGEMALEEFLKQVISFCSLYILVRFNRAIVLFGCLLSIAATFHGNPGFSLSAGNQLRNRLLRI